MNEELVALVNRIEKLNEEAEAIASDIREVYAEAKNAGYDIKTLKKVIALRKMDYDEVAEQEELLNTYKQALGM